MSCKHVDILAVGALLIGMALFSAARYTPLFAVPHKSINYKQFHRPSVVIPKPLRLTLAFD